LLCSVGSDTAIHLFDAESGDHKVSLPGEKEHNGSIYGCAFSPDSKQLLTVGGDKTVKLWDVEKGVVVSSIVIGNNTEDMQVAVGWAKGGSLGPVTVSLGGDLNVVDLATGGVSTRVKAHCGEPYAVTCDWTSDKKEIYVGDASGGITRYTEADADHVSGRGHTAQVIRVTGKKGKIYSSSVDDTIKLIDGLEFKSTASIGAQAQNISLAFDKPDFVAFVTEKKAGIVSDGRILSSVDLGFFGQGVALSPKGDFLVVGEKDSKNPQARVYSVSADGTKITPTEMKCTELAAPPISMQFSHDGKYLAIGDSLKEVTVWDGTAFTPFVKGRWSFHTSTINAVSWSPDNKFILSVSNDSHAYIWNVNSPGKKLKIAFAHKTGVYGGDWTGPNTIVTCGADRCVRTWVVTLPV